MTFTQLEYIVAVYEHRHFNRAAQSCHVSQPTLSIQIQKLEGELEVDIFDRSKSPVGVSEIGEQIVAQARVILKQRDRVFSEIINADQIQGEFKVAVIPTIAPYLLPLFIERFGQQYPKVNLIVSELQTEQIISRLHRDDLDAGILATPLEDQSIYEEVLFYEPFFAFTSANSSISKNKKVSENDLSVSDIWLLSEGHCLRNQVIKVCNAKTSTRSNFQFQTGSLETLKNIVAGGNGYTLLPQLAKETLSLSDKSGIREFKRPVPAREVSVVYTRPKLKALVRDALKSVIVQSLPDTVSTKRGSQMRVVGLI